MGHLPSRQMEDLDLHRNWDYYVEYKSMVHCYHNWVVQWVVVVVVAEEEYLCVECR